MAIDSDIPCAQCGYNLRTLGREGRCPECGEEIWPSIEKFNTSIERWPPLIAESVESLTSRFEGCVLCIIAFVVNQSFWTVYMSSSWGFAYQPWMLGPSSATLVLLWWGLLKLALPRDSKSRQGVLTAVCATGSLLLPIITVYVTDYRRQFTGSFQLFLQVAMPVMWILAVIAVPMSFAVLAKWLRRAGRPIFAILAIMGIALSELLSFLARVVVGISAAVDRSSSRGGYSVRLITTKLNQIWLDDCGDDRPAHDYGDARNSCDRFRTSESGGPPVPPGQKY